MIECGNRQKVLAVCQDFFFAEDLPFINLQLKIDHQFSRYGSTEGTYNFRNY